MHNDPVIWQTQNKTIICESNKILIWPTDLGISKYKENQPICKITMFFKINKSNQQKPIK